MEKNKILNELTQAMPAPFQPGTNIASEPKASVQYRLPAGNDLGYLELLAAPWSERRAVLAVLGNSDVGVAAALLSPDLRAKMTGNLTLINQGQLDSSAIALQTSALRAVDPSSAGELTNSTPVTTLNTVEAPAWLIPAIIGSVALLLLLLLITLWMTRGRKREQRIEIEEEV